MQFLRRYRFPLAFLALLLFCSAMVLRQFVANQSRHIELRKAFVFLHSKGYKPEAERLYKRLLRDLEKLPDEMLMEDYECTLMLVDPLSQQPDNLIWRYHWTVSNEIERRAPKVLMRARKLAEEEK